MAGVCEETRFVGVIRVTAKVYFACENYDELSGGCLGCIPGYKMGIDGDC